MTTMKQTQTQTTDQPPPYGGNRIPKAYLARFLPSQGRTQGKDLPDDLERFLGSLYD